MKIFELNWESQGEKEWIAAHTNIEALQVYCSITGTDLNDLDVEDTITEVPREKWTKMTVRDPDDSDITRTFAQWMKDNKKPDIIAGTMDE